MLCADASQLMDEMFNGGVDSEREAALLAHFADCAPCRAEWTSVQEVHRLLSLAPMVPPPPNLTAKVMANLSRRRPAQNPWAGAIALFAGTVVLSLLAGFSFVGLYATAELASLLENRPVSLSELGAALLQWAEAAWLIRQTMLGFVPPGFIVFCALLSLLAIVIWLKLIAGVQNALQLVGE